MIYCVMPYGVLLCVWLLRLCAVCLKVFVSFVCDALCGVVWCLCLLFVLCCDCVWSVKCMCVSFANDCVMVYGLCCLFCVVVCVCACVCACKQS